jgi:hypothetical protein
MKNGIPGPIDLGPGIFFGESLTRLHSFYCSSWKGGEMASSNHEGIEEVFVIQANAIDFFAALVKAKPGKSGVHGKIRFQDGKRWYFHYPAGERAAVRNRLLTVCEAIAKFYGTNVFCQKFDGTIGYGEFIHLLREAKHTLN